VIVVDDGSTDRTAQVCRSRGDAVRYLYQQNQGAAAARNAGIEASRGQILAFLDSDDLWTPNSLEVRMERLSDEPKVIFGMEENFFSETLDEDERALRAMPTGTHRGFNPSAMITSRDTFDLVGPFDAGIRVGEFLDWYMRARDAGVNDELVPEVVARRRIHDANTGITNRETSGYLTALRKSIQRHNASS
jgi:glycosyltransferase involved in cell wall biosynthesis